MTAFPAFVVLAAATSTTWPEFVKLEIFVTRSAPETPFPETMTVQLTIPAVNGLLAETRSNPPLRMLPFVAMVPPGFPCGPVEPVAPVAPVGPVEPVGPAGPVGPGEPAPLGGSCVVGIVSAIEASGRYSVDRTFSG